MDHAEGRIAVADFVGGNHARGYQIVNLVEIDRLRLQLFPDGIQAFDAALEAQERHLCLFHFLLDRSGHIVEKRFVGSAAFFQLRGQVAIVVRVEMLERKILQLAAQFSHTQPMRDRRVDIHCLLRDPPALFGVQIFQSAHVVQAIGQLDQHHADIVNHRQQHFADVFSLLLLARDTADVRDLRQAFHEVGDFISEIFANRVLVGQSVFDDVMQQAGGYRHGIHAHVGKNVRDLQRMDQVGFPRLALLPFVLARREKVSAAQQIQIRLRVVAFYLLANVFDSNHGKAATTEGRDQSAPATDHCKYNNR